MSLETPDNPSRPLFVFNTSSLFEADSFSFRSRNASTPGSRSPHRVPMIKPSSGVKPMLVSTDRPLATALIEQPAPR